MAISSAHEIWRTCTSNGKNDLGAMTEPKLPQARLYLKSAQWGIGQLVDGKLIGYPFRFYLIGILASLRAVQHALFNHDATISPAHERVIGEWWNDPLVKNSSELLFIKTARDLILKEGAFSAWATASESGTGEGTNYTVTGEDYDLGYWIDGVRHDLHADLRNAVAWCERELANIKSKLP